MSTSSEYEKIREENLKKNEIFLAAIGLGPGSGPLASHGGARSSSKRSNKSSSKSSSNGSSSNATLHSSSVIDDNDYELRRSSRVRKVVAVPFDPSAIDKIENWEERGSSMIRKRSRKDNVGNEEEKGDFIDDGADSPNANLKTSRGGRKTAPVKREPAPIDLQSSRACNCDFGQFSNPDKLGLQLSEHGKAYVMSVAYGGRVPKFSKYSGVVEWQNCVFLWVNIGDVKYGNVFSNGGELMVWFGGSLMTEDSPITKRLIANKKDDPIVLFVRLSASDPYVSLGQVEISSHKIDIHPIEITWRLLSFKNLKNTAIFKSINNSKN